MHFKNFSAAVFGIDAYLMEVEVDVGSGRPGDFNIVGLPDIAVKESRERIKAALKNCGHEFPLQSVTVNLAPADIRKEGSALDLPMALSILGCEGAFFGKQLDQYIFLGELALDGQVRSVRGSLSAALAAREHKIRAVVVPEANAREAAVVEGIDVFAVRSLPQAVDLVNAPESFVPVRVDASSMLADASQYAVDMRDVRGQQAAKRALEVACAGGHNIIFSDGISNVQPVPRNGRGRELFKTPNDAVQVQSLSGFRPKELLVSNFHQGLQRSAAHDHAGFPVPLLDATKSLLHRGFDLLRHFRSPA
ncbi:MAG TPA: magnesium chelatase domain-containing protein [Candidatus Acidoferrales bacterium]|jgi:magnesium chelatase family protein|nr:magnesium chelatase domain-containing protein [Candidatus Acidoferrales bacterium]